MALAKAAESLIGCRFRLHGRDPETGLDCIGVLSAALTMLGRDAKFPTGYRLRTERYADLAAVAARHGFVPADERIRPGDVLFTRPGPAQLHLLIAATRTMHFVEAHAGLGRVVMSPGPLADPILQKWRLRAPD